MIAIDLSKQQASDAGPKVIKQIYFTRNLNWDENLKDNTTLKKQKKSFRIFLKELWKYCDFILF